jgi:alkylation response protein AidB-like acyl-CoA dehydrogenase
MDLDYGREGEEYREKVHAFLAEHLPADWTGIGALDSYDTRSFSEDWRDVLYERGLLAPAWPKEYGGGGLSLIEQVVLAEELARAGLPSGVLNDGPGLKMLGNTLLRWGTEEQKRHFLPRILSGADRWCQGYSEPDAGSDLASLSTRAVLDGGEWVVNGQKIWTSGARSANWIFVLARTTLLSNDAEASKHRGITFLLVPMDQPGVEVRPIDMMNGGDEFCETYFTDARTPAANVVGEVDGGWAVAMTLLGYERGESAATTPIGYRLELDRLVELAKESGRSRDPLIRQRLAACHAKVEIMGYLGKRTLTRFLAGEAPGAESSVFKLYWSEYHQEVTELAVDIVGAAAMVPEGRWRTSPFGPASAGAPNDSASWVSAFLSARAGTIYAGTSEIQRNIVAERILGLPR